MSQQADDFYRTALTQAENALRNLREAMRTDRRRGNERYSNFRLLDTDSHLANAVLVLRGEVVPLRRPVRGR